ncbi:MAG: glutathione S-transferase family protein [Rhodospirillaceae bacterium]|nr:glutathione S-transferase family protein [Rhodospirillaceae bacterium]
MLELYHNDMSSCAQKVRLTLAEKGIEWKGHHMNLRAGDTRTPEYLKMNRGGVVPTLLVDGTIICESTVICEYLDDAYPDIPVRPSDPIERARMRAWTKQLDEGLHADTGTISGGVAFRHQTMAGRTIQEFMDHMNRMPDPVRRDRTLENNLKGVESSYFPGAIKRWDALFGRMETALQENTWITGADYSLADISYTPYVVRMDHLHFMGLFDDRPKILDWYERIQARPNFVGISDWINDKYIPLMAEKGEEVWPRVKEILAA